MNKLLILCIFFPDLLKRRLFCEFIQILADNMFRRVALITFANLLVKNQILLKNKQMICRHLTFTFHFHFSGTSSQEFFKKNHPSGVLPSQIIGLPWGNTFQHGFLERQENIFIVKASRCFKVIVITSK